MKIFQLRNSFTLIELVVVIGIIGLLTAIGIASFSAINKQSRDNKRQADLENIRIALDQYRSNTGTYPKASSWQTDIEPTYINPLPTDPKNVSPYIYTYTPAPSGCNGTTTSCTTYTISARMEASGSTFSQNQYGDLITPAPTATTAPTSTPTTTPTSAPGATSTPTPTKTPTPTNPPPSCRPWGASCTSNGQCCSNSCTYKTWIPAYTCN